MANVLYQYKTYKDNKPYVPIVKGTCSKCGESVAYSQYGWDEECPNCGEDLDWGVINEERR